MNRSGDGGRHLQLAGEYDIADKDSLAALFGALAPGGAVVIDMTAVTYIDSTLLHELETLRSRLGDRITLLGMSRHAGRVLRIVNLDHLFQLVEAQT
ncbi:MAG: STAS domain-containing protein [Candidatus Cybelea sp.]